MIIMKYLKLVFPQNINSMNFCNHVKLSKISKKNHFSVSVSFLKSQVEFFYKIFTKVNI